MAATVIDSFVVELGLDPTKFDATQKKVVNNFKKNQDELESRAKNTDKAAGDAAVSIGGLARQAAGMFAAFGAGKFLASFTTEAVSAAAATNRLSNTIGTNVTTLSKWQGVAKTFGGDAGAMANSFTQLSDAFAGWKIGDVSPLIGIFRAISTAGGVTIDMNKGVEQSLLDLAENFKNIAAGPGGKEQVGLLGRKLGLDPATISLMMQGSARLREELARIQGLTQANADAADKLDQRWNGLILKLQQWGQDKVLKIAPEIESALSTDAQDIHAVMSLWDKFNNWRQGKGFVGSPGAPAAPSGPASPAAGGSVLASGARAAASMGTGGGAFSSQEEKAAFIRQAAIKNGIDPNIALSVAKSEGFNSYVGDRNSSFGAFQLHYGGVAPGMMQGGLGDRFTKQTGLDARDRSTEREQIEFAMKYAATSGRGWADWYGARNTGISQFAGIGQGGGGGGGNTTIDTVNIYPPPGTDGHKMANDFRDTVTRQQSRAANANSGGQ